MRILQVCNKVPYPLKDGGALAIHNLTKGFSDAGAEVCLLAMNTSRHQTDKSKTTAYFKNFQYLTLHLVDVNTNINLPGAIRNLIFSSLPYTAERFIDKNFGEKLKNILKTGHFDIVQFEGLYLMPYTGIVRRHSGAKIVLRAHNIENEIWFRNFQQEKNLLKKRYIAIIAKRLKKFELNHVNKYDLLVPITVRDVEIYNNMGNLKPTHVCPYGYTGSPANTDNLSNQNLSFFFIGSLDWMPNQQGISWFVENVWGLISGKIEGIRFYVAGRNAPQWLVNYLENHDVIYAGEVEDANEFMKNKGTMVVPLFSGSGMRVKIVEAMAAGKAVISTAIGAEGIDITDSENIILADTPEDFAGAAKKLCSDRDFYLQIAKNAVKFVNSKLVNTAIVDDLLEFYKMNI
ncbi:MAG: glycosyltransferase family 4 protein [Bacteroidales bacterium]|nr:glycosyltransferase family 4 protein [Bacteroidales bacterium]